MSRRKGRKGDTANPANVAALAILLPTVGPTDVALALPVPVANTANTATVAELAVPPAMAAPITMADLLAEQFPQGAPARLAGGMAIALQRELRRRNRKAEKGY